MRKRSMGLVPIGRGGADLVEASKRGELARLMDENDEQYAAFLAYCQAGPEQTLQDIAKQVDATQGWLSRLRKNHQWDGRILDWRLSRKQPDAVVLEDPDWLKRREDLRCREWEAHKRVVDLCNRFLEKWKFTEELPSIGEIAKMMELASKLGRAAAVGYAESGADQTAQPFRIQIEAALARAYGREEKPAVVEMKPAPLEIGAGAPGYRHDAPSGAGSVKV